MLIGYDEDEDEGFEDALQHMPVGQKGGEMMSGEGEDFQSAKKMFAAQMRAELLGQPVP